MFAACYLLYDQGFDDGFDLCVDRSGSTFYLLKLLFIVFITNKLLLFMFTRQSQVISTTLTWTNYSPRPFNHQLFALYCLIIHYNKTASCIISGKCFSKHTCTCIIHCPVLLYEWRIFFRTFGLVWFILRPCQHDDGHRLRSTLTNGHRFTALGLSGRSPIQVLTEVDVA